MMGRKTLAEIRAELKAALEKDIKDPVKWFNQHIRRLKRSKSAKKKNIDLWVGLRDSLFKNAKRTARKKKVS